MPPEYVSARSAGRVGEPELLQQAVGNRAGIRHVPQVGDEHEVLPAGEDPVDGGELAGEADLLADVARRGRRRRSR